MKSGNTGKIDKLAPPSPNGQPKANGAPPINVDEILDERRAIQDEDFDFQPEDNDPPPNSEPDPEPERAPKETDAWVLHDLGDVEEWEAEPLEWLVQDLIPKGGIGFLSGAPKDGKSLLACDMMLHIAHQKPWLDTYECGDARILYIAREDPRRRLKERFLESNEGYGYGTIPKPSPVQFLIRDRFDLTKHEHIDWLFETALKYKFNGLVLDVLNRMIPGLDELSAHDMAQMVGIIETINREQGLTILCLDHTRKPSGGKGSGRDDQMPNPFDLKGSVAKYGAADFMMCLARTETPGRLQLYCENKDTDERPHFLLDVSPKDSGKPKFTYAGNVDKFATDMKAQAAANRKRVYEALTSEWEGTGTIAARAKLTGTTVAKHLGKLQTMRAAEKQGSGGWTKWRRLVINPSDQGFEPSHEP